MKPQITPRLVQYSKHILLIVGLIGLGLSISGPSAQAQTLGEGAFAAGGGSAPGYFSIAIGQGSYAPGSSGIAVGGGNAQGNYGSIAIGPNSISYGYQNVALGSCSQAGNMLSVAFPYSIAGYWGFAALGGYADWDSVAFGDCSCATGFSTALGDYAVAQNLSIALGYSTSAVGQYSAAVGGSTTALGDYSVAMGEGTIAATHNSMVVGCYNVAESGDPASPSHDPIFTIGNGKLNQSNVPIPSNALVVRRNGDTKINGKLTVTNSVIVPESGDLSMGQFTAGTPPQ